MKKFVCMLLALAVCLTLVAPVFAEDSFVPSITYKPEPEIIPVVDENGEEHTGIIIRNEDGEVVGYVDEGCLAITPVAHIWDNEEEVPAVVEKLLRFVYEGLNSGELNIPYEKHGEDLDASNMVVRDLFDARFYCEECPEMLEPKGIVMELTFDLGVVPEAQIYAQSYDEATGEWSPVVKTVNNGDGTVTCTFEHLCAIAFSMAVAPTQAPVEEPEAPNTWLWLLVLIAAVVLIVVFVIGKNKKKAKV